MQEQSGTKPVEPQEEILTPFDAVLTLYESMENVDIPIELQDTELFSVPIN